MSVTKNLANLPTYLALTVSLTLGVVGCGGAGAPPEETSVTQPKETKKDDTPSNDVAVNWQFSDITQQTGLRHQWGLQNDSDDTPMEDLFSGGIAVGDFNNDGLQDLFIDSGDVEPSKLYLNLGDNKFTDIAQNAGVQLVGHLGSGPIFVDLNEDGWLDLFVGGISGSGNRVFINNQDSTFRDETFISGLTFQAKNTVSASFGDFNKDGFLDGAFAHWGNELQDDTETIFRGYGNGTFYSAASYAGVSDVISNSYSSGILGIRDYSFSPTMADLNNDGWLDLTLVSDFGYSRYFLNDGYGHFISTEERAMADRNGMGTALGDYDNDGDLDWFVSAIYETSDYAVSSAGNRLYENNGDGFTDATFFARVESGGWGWGACFADFNNDGWLDIFHTNGWNEISAVNPDVNNYVDDASRLFINKGNKQFAEQAADYQITDTGQGRAVVCFDSDNDGDMDLIVINNDPEFNSFIFYENQGANEAGNYLQVSLVGQQNNSSAIGARVYVTTGETTQMRELISGGNYISQVSMKLHFGLASASQIDKLEIVWPDGTKTEQLNVEVNQRLTFNYSP